MKAAREKKKGKGGREIKVNTQKRRETKPRE
jgi:hypothetical protein